MSSSQPWVEKYRPRNISEVVFQNEVIKTLENALTTNNLPHLLLYGPPGTGKTSTALAIARQLYGPELAKTRVLELNASDERGINVVRQKIKSFASGAVGASVPGYPCPPFKLLILDEADSMTQDAQNALRRTMELTSKVTRFCFICNYVSRIIEPLASRCAKFRFRPLHLDVMSSRIQHICDEEELDLDPDVMQTLSRISGGDLRRAITTLQSAARRSVTNAMAAGGAGGVAAGKAKGRRVISQQSVLDVSGQIPADLIAAFWAKCKPSGRFELSPPSIASSSPSVVSASSSPAVRSKPLFPPGGSASFEEIQDAVQALVFEGFAAQQILAQLQDEVLRDPVTPPLARAKVLDLLAAADAALANGADETIQILNVAGQTRDVLVKVA